MEKCEAVNCTLQATRTIGGHHFCPWHREGNLVPEAPLVLCAIHGCGSPAADRGLCRYHASHVPPQRAA